METNNMDYELMLFDRLNVIRDTVNKYGEENFYIAFSGGKDSTCLHYIIDMALPNNRIPRVYVNTGIGLKKIDEFVEELSKNDDRIVIIKPQLPIKQTLEKYGYPFKSKYHSYMVEKYQRLGMTKGVKNYLNQGDRDTYLKCPQKLKYQFSSEFKVHVSDLCCKKMKEEPMKKWSKENNKTVAITGVMKEEGGRRSRANCLNFHKNKLIMFQPFAVITKEFENEFIERNNIKLCELYYEPYNFKRTGCKGCPFALDLQHELDALDKLLPIERKQCEIIWKPIYEEYRRLNYRLKRKEQGKLF